MHSGAVPILLLRVSGVGMHHLDFSVAVQGPPSTRSSHILLRI